MSTNWDVEPVVALGACGWMATTPRDHPYRVGVVGDSEDQARRRFADAMFAWRELHERTGLDVQGD